MSLPEGLHLTLTPGGELAIFDAQDVMWVAFHDGGYGDPIRWPRVIVTATCAALGVSCGITDEGDEVSVPDLLHLYFGEEEFVS